MSEVTDALEALATGKRSIEDVEEMFRRRTWPAHGGEPPPDGSFGEVVAAYNSGRMTLDQYTRLAAAYNTAMWQPNDTPQEGQ